MKLTNIQKKLRFKILELAYKTGSGHSHLGSCFSCIDILIQTHIFEMKREDKFILSKGHASLALYVVLNHLGKISDKRLESYFKEGTEFGIHTPSTMPDDIPIATGSLGHGLSFACGIAYGYKLKKSASNVHCLMSDGECNEGAVWEAAQFASAKKLNNLIALIDKNNIQAFGKTKEILGDGAAAAKWKAFGFNVVVCDGHNLQELEKAFKRIRQLADKMNKPHIIIAKTVRGKGIKSLEDKVESNYLALTDESYKRAVEDINKL